MAKAFAYLGSGHGLAPWPGPPAAPPAAYTYVVAANGLFAHVAQGTFRGTLALARWPEGAIRGLLPLELDGAGDLQRGLAALLHERACPSPERPLACAVARDPADPLWAAYGACAAATAPPGLATYIVARDGVYAWASAAWGDVRAPAALFGAPLLPWSDPVRPGLHLRAPRIPAALLAAIIADARGVAAASGHERLWFLTWRPGARWGVAAPPQGTAPGRVTYRDADRPAEAVATIHSHGRFGVFFSPTDDHDDRTDDRAAYLNIVLGDLTGDGPPGLLCRASACGSFLTVPAADLVAGPLPAVDYALHPADGARRPDVPRADSARDVALDTRVPAAAGLDRGPEGAPGRASGRGPGRVPRLVAALLRGRHPGHPGHTISRARGAESREGETHGDR